MHALDADEGNFGRVKYYITTDNADMFRLDPDTGILYPRQSLKGMKGKLLYLLLYITWKHKQNVLSVISTGKYVLAVEARDEMGSGMFADNAEIVIEIQSINSYRPVFIMPALTNASVELPEVI